MRFYPLFKPANKDHPKLEEKTKTVLPVRDPTTEEMLAEFPETKSPDNIMLIRECFVHLDRKEQLEMYRENQEKRKKL